MPPYSVWVGCVGSYGHTAGYLGRYLPSTTLGVSRRQLTSLAPTPRTTGTRHVDEAVFVTLRASVSLHRKQSSSCSACGGAFAFDC